MDKNGENSDSKNLRDSSSNLPLGITVSDSPVSISYNRTNKLIMALYMVTDIMDTQEPVRLKLRSLGADVLSDMYSRPEKALPKIAQVMSFLEIALTVKLVSEMNVNILKNEFIQLKKSVEELSNKSGQSGMGEVDLSDFFTSNLPEASVTLGGKNFASLPTKSNSIGVQKGSTLLKALREVNVSNKNTNRTPKISSVNFDTLKKERRDQIKDIVGKNSNGVTITDIRKFAYGSLADCGEKTLQRELIAMVKDAILRKTGEKRWSRYFLVTP